MWKFIERMTSKKPTTARELAGFPIVYDWKEVPANIAAIQDDRIMADGRPAHAWWCELEMLRNRELEIQKIEMALAEKFTVLRIAEWAIMPLMTVDGNDDLIIRVKRTPMILSKISESDLAEHPEKYCEVLTSKPEVIPSEERRGNDL